MNFFNIAAVTALAAGMAFGQGAPAQNPPHAGRGMRMGRMSADLNLTDAQKQQAQSIFAAARQSAQPLQEQMKQNREALAAAVKSGASDAEIDRLSNILAPLLAQSTAIHTKAFAKFYGILTPEQKDKLGSRFEQMIMGGAGGGFRGGDQPHAWRRNSQ